MEIESLWTEYEAARRYTRSLYDDLPEREILWRPSEDSSGIGWHLGHQAAVNHFMVRNLIAAEPRARIEAIRRGDVGAPRQLRHVAAILLAWLVNTSTSTTAGSERSERALGDRRSPRRRPPWWSRWTATGPSRADHRRQGHRPPQPAGRRSLTARSIPA